MTLNLTALENRFSGSAKVDRIAERLVRLTRHRNNIPFAVYYVDFSHALPETPSALADYQDRFIAPDYFTGPKSLQWNNYLFFVTTKAEFHRERTRRAKELIEADRSYARKRVLVEQELEAAVAPPSVQTLASLTPRGPIDEWLEILRPAGLVEAVLAESDLPRRVALIQAPPGKADAETPRPSELRKQKPEQFLRSLELKSYREFPRVRRFEFGTANLIVGANGAGKTSLLEAIELFYCGKNFRNPHADGPYELVGQSSEKPVVETQDRSKKELRERSLAWYGHAQTRTNDLHVRFAQFNFLNTDAAVSLADSAEDIEEDLAALLVGPDAARIWRDIERVRDAVKSKLREIRPLEKRIAQDLAELEKRAAEAKLLVPASAQHTTQLVSVVRKLKWTTDSQLSKTRVTTLVDALREFIELARQVEAIRWLKTPLSTDALELVCREQRVRSERAQETLSELNALEKTCATAEQDISRSQEALTLLRQLLMLAETGVLMKAENAERLQRLIVRDGGMLAGIDFDALKSLPEETQQQSLSNAQRQTSKRVSEAHKALELDLALLAEHSKSQKLLSTLSSSLRKTALQIVDLGANSDVCPLCGAKHAPGALVRSINRRDTTDLQSKILTNRVDQSARSLDKAVSVQAVLQSLGLFAEHTELRRSIKVQEIAAAAEKVRLQLANSQKQLKATNAELSTLRGNGFSTDGLTQRLDNLRALGYPIKIISVESIGKLIKLAEGHVTDGNKTLGRDRERADQLRVALTDSLGRDASKSIEEVVSRYASRASTLDRLHVRLGEIELVKWPRSRPFAELMVDAQSILSYAEKAQAAFATERKAKATSADDAKREKRLKKERAEIGHRVNRLQTAENVFADLIARHSLTTLMTTALQANRTVIDAIFRRIHSPSEFSGMGKSLGTLIRKIDGKEAGLREVSTGQRAAFALSVFIAQNAKLSIAPPLILIDDPIAHVDDLNALSFLDLLREIAVEGNRQIFFATADARLAALAERKLDFLGPDQFRRFDLERDAQA